MLPTSLQHITTPSAGAQIHALQFEWAWQHPQKSLAVREEAAALKKASLNGAKGKVRPVSSPRMPWPTKQLPLCIECGVSLQGILAEECGHVSAELQEAA